VPFWYPGSFEYLVEAIVQVAIPKEISPFSNDLTLLRLIPFMTPVNS
jgi:hypothetical protein